MIRSHCHWCSFFFIYLFATSTIIAQNQQDIKNPTDSLPSRRSLLIFPVIARSIETDWAFGAAGSFTFRPNRKDTSSRTSNIQGLGLYSLNKQLVIALNGTTYFANERYILNQQISYSYFPDSFWGIGPNAPESNKESYIFKQYYIYPHLQRRIGRRFFLGMLYEYQRLLEVDYKKGGLLDREEIPGKNGYQVSGVGFSFTWDSRNHAFVPDKGELLQIQFNHFNEALGSDYRYTNYMVDLRKFIKVYKKQVLALQLYGFFNDGVEVPLRSLASFGGYNSMRGYYDGRYRDRNQFVFQTEYRFPIYWRFGGVVFGSTGNVTHRFKDISLAHLKYSYGLGLRFQLNRTEKLNLRLDYGIGQDSSRGLYFQLAEAF
ncbi:BamA/TamA family outer membrane protein [Xanthocytophaga agilis]|uniref:BamA/TamA family outer membrane protein n=1 Tax=Xanthocytophaga agilis TaxID=3048010 RepID=A0AAE3RCI9_9BACT|nr:BamA/TamA family outer membrane protein [Xanthocytophaga agilis]MDJ1505962.1 BamA/TamA family outer membrane protein [Xanthocytophaga agilis]